MARKLSLLLGFIFLVSLSAHAQDRGELFGGYSFERLNSSPATNLNGWEVSGQFKFANWLGVVGDIDAHYGPFKTVSFMAGPQVSFPGRISPFVHVLVGVGHIRSGPNTDTSWSTAFGGGVDLRIAPIISWRVIQADDVVTHFFGGRQNNARITTGIVLRF